MDRQRVEASLKGVLDAFPELFLIDLSITSRNNIYIRLDDDQGVSLKDCTNIIRHLEENFYYDAEDYSLEEVSSAGGSEPLKYTGNI
ncbi:MAG: hypothetical protein ABI045_00325 [Flavobacteriales bacterium]